MLRVILLLFLTGLASCVSRNSLTKEEVTIAYDLYGDIPQNHWLMVDGSIISKTPIFLTFPTGRPWPELISQYLKWLNCLFRHQ